jgi:hypothetical protein
MRALEECRALLTPLDHQVLLAGAENAAAASMETMFADEADGDDLASGTIYVLRSKSEHPVVAAHRDVLHKIGVTGGDVDPH